MTARPPDPVVPPQPVRPAGDLAAASVRAELPDRPEHPRPDRQDGRGRARATWSWRSGRAAGADGLMAERGAAVVAVEIDPAMAAARPPRRRRAAQRPGPERRRAGGQEHDQPRGARQRPLGPGRRRPTGGSSSWPTCRTTSRRRSSRTCWSHPELCPALMVVTIQLELAERMRAEPGTDGLRRRCRSWCRPWPTVEIVRALPPTVFWPRPKVDSAVVAIGPDPAKRAAIGDLALVPLGRPPDLPPPPQEPPRTSSTASGATAGRSPRSTPCSRRSA